MPIARMVLAARAVLLSVVITFTAPTLLQLFPGSPQAIAEATVASDDKQNEEREKEKEKERREKQQYEDRVLNGQVLEIDTHKNPPEMIVGTVDGRATVRVLKTDEIAMNDVGVGDYVELTGEKINELLFEATEISVGQRFDGPRPASGPPQDTGESEPSDDAEPGDDAESGDAGEPPADAGAGDEESGDAVDPE